MSNAGAVDEMRDGGSEVAEDVKVDIITSESKILILVSF